MASNSATALSSLLRRASLDDHDQVLDAANESLKHAEGDISAQHTRAIALLNLDRYEDALRVFEEIGEALKSQAPLAWCYTLYKCGRLSEAKEAARQGGADRGSRHVEAQAAYRSEDFQRAGELYEDLSRYSSADAGEHSDLRINGSATDAQLAWAGYAHLMRRQKVGREDLEQFETTFNAACIYIAKGDLKQAEILLDRARDLCNVVDELSDDEKKAELLPIRTQQIYVLARLGKFAELGRLACDLDFSHATDATERLIAQVNVLASPSASLNPYMSARLLHSATNTKTRNPPFKFQSRAIARNSLASELWAAKTTSVAESTMATIASAPPVSVAAEIASAAVFNAAAHARNQTGKSALKELLSLSENRSDDVGLLLTIIQLYLFANSTSTATLVLKSFLTKLATSPLSSRLEARFAPGLVAILVALYEKSNRKNEATSELVRAAHYWRVNPKDAQSAIYLFREAGTALLASHSADELKEAHEMFQLVHLQDSVDRIAIAGLTASTADSTAIVTAFEEKLPRTQKLVAGIDVSALEIAGVARPLIASLDNNIKKRSAPEGDARRVKSKKRRKGKLSKAFDPSRQPDLERWLPLRDRSNWKPKGRKKGRGGMSTQGGVVSEDIRPATPSSQVLQQAKPGGASKAKKKKGKTAK